MDLPLIKDNHNILSVKYKKPIDDQLINKLTDYIQSQAKKSTRVITHINGTVNCLLAAYIFKKALGENLLALVFDFNTPQTGLLTQACKNLGLNTYVLNRAEAYYKELNAYHLRTGADITKFYLRFTNYHLLTASEHLKASVVDTEDKSNRLTTGRPPAFYGEFVPFYSLYKTEVYELAKLLNLPAQEEGAEYWKKVDPILFLLTEKQLRPEEISRQYNLDLIWLKKLKSFMDKQALKSTPSQFCIQV